jgi:SSS family solute:Na+ symporter
LALLLAVTTLMRAQPGGDPPCFRFPSGPWVRDTAAESRLCHGKANAMILLSFLFFTAAVAAITWWITRRDDHTSANGVFLAGRSLTFPLIAGSLLLTNLSTEQMVGLNGQAFTDGLSVMAWEVVAVLALVAMALFFLPRFLRSGVTTVPEFLEIRFDHSTQVLCNLTFLTAYAVILLPIILYTGATGLSGMLDIATLTGIANPTAVLWLTVWLVGIVGSVYALFGGLRAVAVSDTLNGVGLLTGGFLIVGFGLAAIGDGEGMLAGWSTLRAAVPEKFNSIGPATGSVPFPTLFSGVLLLNFFYWTTNQQIIQRTFGASSLAEGQKGVLLTGALKLLGPLYLVLPGIIAFHLFAAEGIRPDHAYGKLVNRVLPVPLTGFFTAVMVGAILSSFNSALNSTTTLFSLGLYKSLLRKDATDAQVVRASKFFGWAIAIIAMSTAPLLAKTASIFGYLQKMNGVYFIPIFAVVLTGLLHRRLPPLAAKVGLAGGVLTVAAGYFLPPFNRWVGPQGLHEYHFLGLVFVGLVAVMLLIAAVKPRAEPWAHVDVGAVNMTPWRRAPLVGAALVATVILVYAAFADFSVLG